MRRRISRYPKIGKNNQNMFWTSGSLPHDVWTTRRRLEFNFDTRDNLEDLGVKVMVPGTMHHFNKLPRGNLESKVENKL